MKKVGFEALIYQIDIKSLRSGDKSARVTLEIPDPPTSLLNNLNALHRADKNVGVAIAEIEK